MKAFKLVFASLFFLCAMGASAQQATPTQAPTAAPFTDAKKAAPKVGSYRSVSSRDRNVRAAYAFAVKEQAAKEKKEFAFVKVLKSESQVVAGTNYRICMLVREGKGRSKSVTTVVFRDLQNAWSLTQWVPGGCKDI